MNFKKIILFILTALLMMSSAACDSKKNEKADTGNAGTKGSLKICYMDYDIKIQNALAKFKAQYKGVDVEDIIFHNDEEYKNKITMDILSGEGPDIILIQQKWFSSINKFSSSGILYDLNDFIKKDKEFNIAYYNEKVLDSFEQDGKRLLIPLAFNVNVLTASKKALLKNNIKIDTSNWSYKELLQLVEKFQEESKGKNKYFFSNNFSISDLIKGSGISFVDFKNRKSLFNSKDFVEILEIYKGIYSSICPYETVKNITRKKGLESQVYIMEANSKTSPMVFSSDYSLYKTIGEEMEVFPFPTLRGKKTSPVSYTDQAVGINSNSKNKDAAYNFIKILLSKDLQIMHNSKNIVKGMPINKSAYEEDLNYYMSKELEGGNGIAYEDSGTYEVKNVPLPKTIKTQLDDILLKVDKCEIEDVDILNIVKESLPDFLSGRKSAAQTAKEIDRKVNLYLNE